MLFQPTDLPSQREALAAALRDPHMDYRVQQWVRGLREQGESLSGWSVLNARAERELGCLPEWILGGTLSASADFLRGLPAGHGVGHMARDMLHAGAIATDPSLHLQVSAPELLAGLLGGVFHDFGNAVGDRYEDFEHYSTHADRGAVVIEIVGNRSMPDADSLRTMIELTIAAHTHYTKVLTHVEPGLPSMTIPIWEVDPVYVRGQWIRLAYWLARWCDRADTVGLVHMLRHILTKVQPTADFDSIRNEAVRPTGDSDDDFRHHFNPVVRTPDVIAAAGGIERARGVLEHLLMFANSANGRSVYSQFDSNFFSRRLLGPRISLLNTFIEMVLAEPQSYGESDRQRGLENLIQLCRQFEPALDTDEAVENLRIKWFLLTVDQQNRWTRGLLWLPTWHKAWFEQLREMLWVLKWPSTSGSDSLHPAVARLARELEIRVEGITEAFAPGQPPLSQEQLLERVVDPRVKHGVLV